VFNIHGRPQALWEATIDAKFILNPYVAIGYFTSHLTKVNKYVTRKNVIFLYKCKHEENNSFKIFFKKLN